MLKIQVVTDGCNDGECYEHGVTISDNPDRDAMRLLMIEIVEGIQTLYASEGVRSILIEVE